jgi:Contractile injection system tube protein/LysM domain
MTLAAIGAGANIVGGIGIGIAAMAGAQIPAMIRCTDPTALGLVYFDLNPDNITMSRSAKTGTKPNAQGGASPRVLQKSDPPTIQLTKCIMYGEDTKMRADTLLAWCAPPQGLITALVGLLGVTNSNQPTVTFQWGPPMLGFMYDALVTKADVKYTRFHSSGIPIRAEVNVTLKVQPSLLGSLPTNPTSGGLPGRTTHLVRENESLQSIAQQHYSRPGLWRKIAEINGIDNPQRLRPGTTVFLPGAGELEPASR